MTFRFLPFVLAKALLLSCLGSLYAQPDTIESPMSILHGVYQQLDPALMPQGVLFQSAFPLHNISLLNGKRAAHDSLRVGPNQFGKVLFTLATAVRDTTKPALFDTGYRDHYASKASSEHVELTGVLAAGGLLLNDAFTNGWLIGSSDSTQLLQQPGFNATAYATDTVFTFSPTVAMLGGPSVTWHFTDSLFYGNVSWPTSFQFDPGDGQGTRNLGFGDSLQVDYTGLDTIRLELRFNANGRTYRAYSWTKVPLQQRIMMQDNAEVIRDVPGTSIEVMWADADCQTEFTNTLIVVDGIDPSTTQNVEFRDDDGQGAYQKYRAPPITPTQCVSF